MPTLRQILSLGLGAIALWGCSSPAMAVPLPPAGRPQPVSLDQVPATSASQPDARRLFQAIANFFQDDRYQTQSTMVIEGQATGLQLKFEVQIQAIAQLPNQFRAEITFPTQETSSSRQYLVVSDGDQVWIYRPDTQEYAVMSYESFTQSDDFFLIGLGTNFFLEAGSEIRPFLTEALQANPNLLREVQQLSGVAIQASWQEQNGQRLEVYDVALPDSQGQFQVAVDPQTASVNQIQIRSQQEGLKIQVTETLLNRVANPSLGPETFRFLPPARASQVEALSIEPFDIPAN